MTFKLQNLQFRVSTTILRKYYKATSQTENKEKKVMMRIVSIARFYSEFHKALY